MYEFGMYTISIDGFYFITFFNHGMYFVSLKWINFILDPKKKNREKKEIWKRMGAVGLLFNEKLIQFSCFFLSMVC